MSFLECLGCEKYVFLTLPSVLRMLIGGSGSSFPSKCLSTTIRIYLSQIVKKTKEVHRKFSFTVQFCCIFNQNTQQKSYGNVILLCCTVLYVFILRDVQIETLKIIKIKNGFRRPLSVLLFSMKFRFCYFKQYLDNFIKCVNVTEMNPAVTRSKRMYTQVDLCKCVGAQASSRRIVHFSLSVTLNTSASCFRGCPRAGPNIELPPHAPFPPPR